MLPDLLFLGLDLSSSAYLLIAITMDESETGAP